MIPSSSRDFLFSWERFINRFWVYTCNGVCAYGWHQNGLGAQGMVSELHLQRLLQASRLSNNTGQNQVPRERYQSVSEIPPPSKASQGNINMKNKAGCNYVIHKQEGPRSNAAIPTFPSLPARLSEMARIWKVPVQTSGSTNISDPFPHLSLTRQPGLKG